MFTILVLSINKFNVTKYFNIRFMVIAYNQNLYFKIHCKKLLNQYYNSFNHNLMLQKMHTKYEHKIHCKSMCFSILMKT